MVFSSMRFLVNKVFSTLIFPITLPMESLNFCKEHFFNTCYLLSCGGLFAGSRLLEHHLEDRPYQERFSLISEGVKHS